jgi:curved DNA-binding protein CbpA
MPTMYEVLGLAAGAAPAQVKAAFHALAKRSHPDVNGGDTNAAKRFKDINAAYEILSDPKKRAAYDLGLKHKHAERHRRAWRVIATAAASFLVTVGCGLYFLPAALSAHEPKTPIVTAEASSPSPAPRSALQADGFFTLAAKAGLKLSKGALAGTYAPERADRAIAK